MKLSLLLILCVSLCSCHQSDLPLTSTPTRAAPVSRLNIVVADKVGYIDRSGKVVINPQWGLASKFSDGLALVCVGECDGDHLVGYRWTKDFKKEILEQTYKYGYINENGQMVINPMFEGASNFSEGVAAVCVGVGCYKQYASEKGKEQPKWGYIDTLGKTVVTPQFDNVSGFHEGLAAVSIGGKYGYIDKTGKFVINPQYDSGMDFEDGVAMVGVKSNEESKSNELSTPTWKYGYIDREGKYIWQPSK